MNKQKKIADELEETIEMMLFDIDEETANQLIEDRGIDPDNVITSVRSLLTTHVQHLKEDNESNNTVSIVPNRNKATNLLAVSNLVGMLRRQRKLSRKKLAKKSGITQADIEGIEIASDTSVTPRIITSLESFFRLPAHSLSEVAGLIRTEDRKFNERVTAFAAQSPGFDKLSQEERKLLSEFVSFLAERSDETAKNEE